jgi:hypothetical protein
MLTISIHFFFNSQLFFYLLANIYFDDFDNSKFTQFGCSFIFHQRLPKLYDNFNSLYLIVFDEISYDVQIV